jgi:hypothetical protein
MIQDGFMSGSSNMSNIKRADFRRIRPRKSSGMSVFNVFPTRAP